MISKSKVLKKIIEFNGDYWHCNPEQYDKNYFNVFKQMFAYEIWNEDHEKINLIEGYEVLVIWEHEFLNSPEEILKKCKKFLENA
jgi:very-short-patch-repair endonuclease